MKLSKDEVTKIAKLARIELSEAETERFSDQLSGVLSYVEKLNEVNTEGIAETSQVTGLENVLREDVVKPFDDSPKLLDQAPQTLDNQIKVKNVF
jgi:aspartyl-tRNA(Asn)/glutamyl-tRNA(Gln) amidotransferase subunit C